jgi:hypothetical protein
VTQAGGPGRRQRIDAYFASCGVDVLPTVHLGAHLIQPTLRIDLAPKRLLALPT